MAGRIGTIRQFKGPFKPNTLVNIPTGQSCKISISIGESDWMKYKGFKVNINGVDVLIGRTCMYETDVTINNTEIYFPDGAPISCTIDVVYVKFES